MESMEIVEVGSPYAPPHGNTILWRYMGLEKFLSLIHSECLHFAHASTLTDRTEITIPPAALAAQRTQLEQKGLKGRDLEEELIAFSLPLHASRDGVLLSCWSANRTESYALWKIYLDGSQGGVAIKTTMSRLKRALSRGADEVVSRVYIGKVRYGTEVDPLDLTPLSLSLTKSQFYEYEREVRLISLQPGRSEGGVPSRLYKDGYQVPVDLDTLIESIYLSPFAGGWFEHTFRAVVERMSPTLSRRVVTSDVQDR